MKELTLFDPPAKPKRSTARKGNPGQSSRGAAVLRAKRGFGDAIDRQLGIDLERMEFEVAARAIGCEVSEVRGRLEVATLGELLEWTRKVSATNEQDRSGDPALAAG